MLKSDFSIILLFCFIAIFLNLSQAKTIENTNKQPDIKLPTGLAIPKGHKFRFVLFASGVQIYKCTVDANGTKSWPLVEPIADLVNKEKETFVKKNFVAHHFFRNPTVFIKGTVAKATWRSSISGDNSLVTTAVITTITQPSPNIAWLLTKTAVTEGTGAFSNITFVLRVATKGGVPPPLSECNKTFAINETSSIRYTTQYWFIEAAKK